MCQVRCFSLVKLLWVVLVLMAGCSAPKVSYLVPETTERQIVAVEASNFRFQPNEIVAHPGVLVLEVRNIASVDHNLTVEDQSGRRLIEQELTSGHTVSVALNLSEPGEYGFYCDKPLHATFGMKGIIVVKSVP